MNSRQMMFVLGALIACLLLFNGLTIALLFHQRSEIGNLRAQLAARTPNADAGQEEERPPVADVPLLQLKSTPEEKAFLTRRDAFLQQSFTNFQSIPFKPGTNSETVIQRLKVNAHMVGTFNGRRYTGFRFTVPEWIDGDLEWMYFHLTNEANKNRRVRAEWFITPEHGDMAGFTDYRFKPLASYPRLKERFPNSREAFTQSLGREQLQPGQNYAIWFGYLDASAVPDIAVGLTINSARGHREFGTLPLR